MRLVRFLRPFGSPCYHTVTMQPVVGERGRPVSRSAWSRSVVEAGAGRELPTDRTRGPGALRARRVGASSLTTSPAAEGSPAAAHPALRPAGNASRAPPKRGPARVVPDESAQWECPAGTASSSSGFSTTNVSVVNSSEAIEAALASAERVTFTGSITPAPIRSPYSPVAAL